MSYEPISVYLKPFVPELPFTQDSASNTASEDVTISGSGTSMWIANESNTINEVIYFKFGNAAQNASIGNTVHIVYPGTYGTISILSTDTHMAFRSANGTPAFKYMRGTGVA